MYGLLRSLPRVNGTTQYEHMLFQPLIMLTNAETELCLTGVMSLYVSSSESWTSIPEASPFTLTDSMRRGKDLYASGPTTISAKRSVSRSLVFSRSAMHPKTAIVLLGEWALCSYSFCHTRCSALSRMLHVLINITSPVSCGMGAIPFYCSMLSTISLSFTFIWQPYVSML